MANVKAYIGLGSNLGERAENIRKAEAMLDGADGISVVRISGIIETKPLGGLEQPDYLNCVAEIETSLAARELLGILQGIENDLGRKRDGKWSSRTIDMDILLYGSEVIDTPELKVPHERMHLRSFVLDGMCELAGELKHPVLGETMRTLAGRLGGRDFAIDADRPAIISVAGLIGVGKTTWAQKLGERFGCEVFYEPYDDNPFLREVYAGKVEYALDSELYFLVKRAEQLDAEKLEAGGVYISDYLFDVEKVFADLLLDENQRQLHEYFFGMVGRAVVKPAVVLYLTDSMERCLERIQKRNRSYEKGIGQGFLERLKAGYEGIFAGWSGCPVIRVDVEKFDCFDGEDLEHIFRQVRSYICCK